MGYLFKNLNILASFGCLWKQGLSLTNGAPDNFRRLVMVGLARLGHLETYPPLPHPKNLTVRQHNYSKYVMLVNSSINIHFLCIINFLLSHHLIFLTYLFEKYLESIWHLKIGLLKHYSILSIWWFLRHVYLVMFCTVIK